MGASLADQPGAPAAPAPSLAIALGANLPGPAGEPLATLLAVRPLLEGWLRERGGAVRWSPLFRTAPVGGPSGQPDYLNAVLLVAAYPPPAEAPAARAAALGLLARLQALEQRFGRRRLEHWGPRSLDLDLLWWGPWRWREPALELPHPRWQERPFVLAPLVAIDPTLQPPGAAATVGSLLASLPAAEQAGRPAGQGEPMGATAAPWRLPPRPGWPE